MEGNGYCRVRHMTFAWRGMCMVPVVWQAGYCCVLFCILCKHGAVSGVLTTSRFNTVGVSEAISMGTDGMSFSLQSRDLIADSIETVMGAQVQLPSFLGRCSTFQVTELPVMPERVYS